MRKSGYIQILVSVVLLLAILPFTRSRAHSYDFGMKPLNLEHKLTIGFERQVYTIYKPTTVSLSPKTRAAAQTCNTILLRMKLTSRFRMETGLSFKDIDRILNNNGKVACFNMNEPCKISIPLNIQYQLLSERSRLRPYFGAGVQYNINNKGLSDISERDAINNPLLSNEVKYLNIIFTQGLIYDVTPDLQITQSIHILPENGIKPVGINLGIGYRIK
ncbi:MAG: hypothetical protein JNM41_13385 [Flavipsychrobacter sp.]|nr:hypothetical protein [Flavipsychrobacter sp.]